MTRPRVTTARRENTESLDGKTAVITGASGGLGRGCALALAKIGASVILIGRRIDPLDKVAAEVRAVGGQARSLTCDVTDADQVSATFSKLARVDVLVNNAGTNVPQPFLEVSEGSLDLMLSLNVKGSFLVAQAAAREIIREDGADGGGTSGSKGEGGVIINMSSQMGHVGAPNRAVYCATKHAIEGLTKAMAVELAPLGIRVNSVAPTFVETPMTRPFFEDKAFKEDIISRIPLGRVAKMEDVAQAVAFLASPAAAMITGTSLVVDGGWTAQ